jgi:transposase
LGGNKNKENILSRKIPKTGSTTRQKKRALIAVRHSILKSVYHILNDKCEYKELGADYLISRTEAKRKAYLKSELSKLGYAVELKELPPIDKAM